MPSHGRRWFPATLAALLAGAILAVVPQPPPAAAVSHERGAPPGSNDWSCVPSAEHPRPVVLVHGLTATAGLNWAYLSPLLAERGYCVYAFTYGVDPRLALLGGPGGTIDMRTSARELDRFVDKVRASTASAEVDLVGHSEGTVMPRYWMKKLGGAAEVKRFVAYTPLFDGTELLGIHALRDLGEPLGISRPLINLVGTLCGACPQFLSGSEFNEEITADGPGVPGVEITTVMTKYDQLVIPYTSGHLDSAVDNFVLQDVCPSDVAEHLGVAVDPVAAQITFNALDPENARPIECLPLFAAPPD